MQDQLKYLLQKYKDLGKKKLYEERSYEEALEYIVRALQCAELLEDWTEIIDTRLLLGHIYLNSLKDLDYAVTIYTDVLDLLEQIDQVRVSERERFVLLSKYALSKTLAKLEKFNQAIPLLEEVTENIEDLVRKFSAYNDLGLTYWRRANSTQNPIFLDEAQIAYEKAIELCQENDLEPYKSVVLNNLGMVHYDKEQYDLAVQDFTEALSLTDDDYYTACISNELAKTYLKLGNFHKAKQMINKANQILIDYDEKAGEVELLRNLAIEGLYQRKIGNFEDAVNYFELAAKQLEDRELKIEAAETFHQLSLMLKEKGDIRSGRYALKFEDLAKEIENVG